jgi:hypothetical protein
MITALLAMALVLSACGAKNQEPTATPVDPNMIAQQAIQTFAMGLTMTAFAQPTATATLTPAPTNTNPPPTFVLLGTSAPSAAPTASCNNSLWVSDITVPDGTPMAPGQAFTKTWMVKNVGTCTWTPTFKVAFGGIGIQMGGQPTPIGKTVKPDEQIEISVNLVAPNTSGDVQSYWKLQDDSGVYFGTYLTVVIKVAGPTPTKTETPTPTP